MGYPKRINHSVIGTVLTSMGLGVLALLAGPSLAADNSDMRKRTILLAQQTTEAQPSSPAVIQNIQRLLKLLSDRYPKTYGSVDPQRVDGRFGTETKDAIRNYKAISGSQSDVRNGEQLVADILSTLAQMSAATAAESL